MGYKVTLAWFQMHNCIVLQGTGMKRPIITEILFKLTTELSITKGCCLFSCKKNCIKLRLLFEWK